MISRNAQAIRGKFAQFYSEKNMASLPRELERREFGFLLFKEKAMVRHRKFDDTETLAEFIAALIPSDIYYSSAYFEDPEQEMTDKGWLGADLVFDIDSDHIPTACQKTHDQWLCRNCGLLGRGLSPEACPECGEAGFESTTWACEMCLESARYETMKLADMLLGDFGFPEPSVKVYFSGHRGYHVHVDDKSVHQLDAMARKEIVDYVIGLGVKAELHRVFGKHGIALVSSVDGGGWKRRIEVGMSKMMTEATPGEVDKLGLSKLALKKLREIKKVLEASEKKWINIKAGYKSWEEIIESVISEQSSRIDTVVTTDVHRLIRLSGSLHGKTALMKVEAPLVDLSKFDPLKEAVAFKEGTLVVDIEEAPRFRLGDTFYGPYKDASCVELPTAAALLLLCKNAARVVNDGV